MTLMGDAIEVVAQCISGECLKYRFIVSISQDLAAEQENKRRSRGGTDGRTRAGVAEAFERKVVFELNNFLMSVVSELQRCHSDVGVEWSWP